MEGRSKNITVYLGLFLSFSLALSAAAQFSSNAFVKEMLPVIYCLHFVSVLLALPFVSEKMRFVMSPSFLTVAYTYITDIIGGWAFNHQFILWKWNLWAFESWQHTNLMVSYNIVCLAFIHFSYFITKKNKVVPSSGDEKIPRSLILIFLSVFWFFVFDSIRMDLSFLGGLGDLSVPKSLSALVIICIVALNKIKYRYFIYLVILITFATISIENRREAILLVLSIFLLESLLNSGMSLDLKRIAIFALSFLLVVYLILAMSILRGYGDFKTKSFYTAFVSVPAYIEQEQFLSQFFQNIEASISFYHSHQAIESIERDASLKTHGATLMKVFFVPLPRSIVEKPTSIVAAYTGHIDPSGYAQGVSWPINFISELYWNFGYWGCLLVLPFYLLFNRLYFYLRNNLSKRRVLFSIVPLFMYEYFIFFIRGSGLDTYVVYLILSSFVFFGCFLLPYFILVSLSQKEKLLHDDEGENVR